MANLKLSDYVPALKYGADIDVTVDLNDIRDHNGNEVIEIDGVDTAVNFLRVSNAVTADPVLLSTQGTADKGMEFHNDQAEEMLILTPVATAVNEITIKNAATGAEPSIAATGGDTNINLSLTPKGTGNVVATLGGFEEPSETLTAASPTLKVYGTSILDSTSNAVDGTLGSGTFVGQIKVIVMTNSSNSSTISIAVHETSDPEVATFNAVDETGVFMWTGTEWITIFATCTFV